METDSESSITLQEARQLLPTNDQWAINNIWTQDQGKAVARAITLVRTTRISDGSYKNNRGTASYILEENNNTASRIYTVHDILGNESDQSPFRLELGEISMMLAIIKCIIQCYNVKHGTIQLGLDGEINGTDKRHIPTLSYSTIF